MTTASEVKKWVAPLLGQQPDLVLVGRNLILTPVRHIVRGIYFDASWDKHLCRPIWYVNTTCNFAGEKPGFSFQFNGDIYLKRSNEPGFAEDLVSKVEEALRLDFSAVATLSDFLERTNPLTLNGYIFNKSPLSSKTYGYSIVLAALGHVEEARRVLSRAVDKLERSSRDRVVQAEAQLAKRSNSAVGKMDLEWAEEERDLIGKLRPLLTLLESGDRAGIGALLQEWERLEAGSPLGADAVSR